MLNGANKYVLYFCLFMIVFDLVTGFIQSLKNKTFKSSVMREGLYHKVGILFLLALGLALEMSITMIDLGITAPVFKGIATYVILMEIGSILENLHKLNPDLVGDKIKEILGGKIK